MPMPSVAAAAAEINSEAASLVRVLTWRFMTATPFLQCFFALFAMREM
jgi:hypothetical protein